MTKNSLAVAIEALSWMAYAGMGERTALLKAAEEVKSVDPSELRQAHRMVMETGRFQNKLDFLISQISAEVSAETPHGVHSLLRLIAYFKYVDGARGTEVERMTHWARQILGWKELRPYEEIVARLANGNVDLETQHLTESERLAVETCHPGWYVDLLVITFGRSLAIQILKRDLIPVPTYIRVNQLKPCDENDLARKMHALKIEGVKNTLRLDRSSAARTNLLSTGQIVIQDLASIVAGFVASPLPRQSVLDVCASPGNKTTHYAAQMQNEGEICSIELSPNRTAQWGKSVAVAGCSIAQLIRADARTIPVHGEFDVVIADPPCSNTGVFARNPPTKWGASYGQLRDFTSRQEHILQDASKHVRRDGTLVYCTCSILPQENEFIVETFLGRNPGFKIVRQEPFIGSHGLRGLNNCQRFYPHLHDCNGYFIAKMRREA